MVGLSIESPLREQWMMLLSMLSEKQKDENSLISVGRDCQRHPIKSITV